jgi:mRNA interferase HigB
MHVISRKAFDEAVKKYPNNASAINTTYLVLKKGNFRTPQELKRVFKSLDNFKYKDKWWVIDIAGNHLRLLAFIEFVHGKVFVKHIVTHSEYDNLTQIYRAKGG